MKLDERALELLLRYEALRGQGHSISPEELCRDSPELLDEVRRRLGDLRAPVPLLSTAASGAAGVAPLAPPAPAPAAWSASGVRYHPVCFHAGGGMGDVFVARDAELHRVVALKRMNLRSRHHAESRRRFLREAEITGRLEHPGVVPVYGMGQDDDGLPCYAMRFIQGERLADAIARFHQVDAQGRRDRRERRLAFLDLLGRFVAVCKTIAYAHSRGIIHRDLKPANVMLGKYGETLVVDWGLARTFERSEADRASGEETLTPEEQNQVGSTPGIPLGTPAFLSPEQAAGRLDQLGPASDVYSLGATLYCILTGVAPFGEGDAGAVLSKVQRGDLRRPRLVLRQVPAALEAICLKAMALRPERRYPSAKALAEDLEHWLADEPVAAFRDRWGASAGRWIRRQRGRVRTAVVTVFVIIAALYLFFGLGFYVGYQFRP